MVLSFPAAKIWWKYSGRIENFQSHVVEKIFQKLRVRLYSLSSENKTFVAREIQYFELGIFSFNSYVYYLTRGFIDSTRAFISQLVLLVSQLVLLILQLVLLVFSLADLNS